MKKTCSFTGHRPSGFSFGYDETDERCRDLKDRIKNEIIDLLYDGYGIFYTGMAEGADIWAAESVIALSEYFPRAELRAVIPFRGQENTMSREFRSRYERVLDFCAQSIVMFERFEKNCYRDRNYFLVEQCDTLVAVYDEANSRSGTGQTVRYAEKLGKKIINIKPE